MRQGCRESQRSYLGRPDIKLEGNPACESRLRWQESAEAIVPKKERSREGLNKEKDEYSEQFEE
jgi:hypothetical protein